MSCSLFQHLHQLFTLSGYLSLEHFSEIEEEDLDDLSVTKTEDRAKILTAAQLLLDYEGKTPLIQRQIKLNRPYSYKA